MVKSGFLLDCWILTLTFGFLSELDLVSYLDIGIGYRCKTTLQTASVKAKKSKPAVYTAETGILYTEPENSRRTGAYNSKTPI